MSLQPPEAFLSAVVRAEQANDENVKTLLKKWVAMCPRMEPEEKGKGPRRCVEREEKKEIAKTEEAGPC